MCGVRPLYFGSKLPCILMGKSNDPKILVLTRKIGTEILRARVWGADRMYLARLPQVCLNRMMSTNNKNNLGLITCQRALRKEQAQLCTRSSTPLISKGHPGIQIIIRMENKIKIFREPQKCWVDLKLKQWSLSLIFKE